MHEQESPSILYRVGRKLVRVVCGLLFHRVRVLHSEALPAASEGPAVLVVGQPSTLLSAALLAACFDRPVQCLVESRACGLPGSRLRRALARCLNMVFYEGDASAWQKAWLACQETIENGGVVTVFLEHAVSNPQGASQVLEAVATLAESMANRNPVARRLPVVPVHLLLPVARLAASEAFVHLGEPLPMPLAAAPANDRPRLAPVLAEALRRNVFALQAADTQRFLNDLAALFRHRLEEEWSRRNVWRQDIDSFGLSGFVKDWAERSNQTEPVRVIDLCQALNDYREAERRWSLWRLQVEAAAWLKSGWRRAWVAAESLVGLPVALWGLVNHLFAAVVLKLARQWPRRGVELQARNWMFLGLAIALCDALQVAVVAQGGGRATAGFYAATLPVAGLYLLRYARLIPRTRLLWFFWSLEAGQADLERRQEAFVERFNAARNAWAGALGVVC
jgi:hypothetical protein